MPALFLTLLKLIFIALLYLIVWHVARSVAGHTGTFPTRLRERRRGTSVVIMHSDGQAGVRFEVKDAVVVGRSESADVTITDPYASEFHLRFVALERGLTIHDLCSTNGTYVNGRRISTPVALNRGDAVQVGKTVLEVR